MKKEYIKVAVISAAVASIIVGGASSVVAYNFASNQIGFTPTDNAWKVNSVGDAINDLYIKKTGDNYSTDERVVGTWIDGRPIYQKTFDVASIALRSGESTTISTGLTDMDLLIDAKARLTSTETNYNNHVLSFSAYGLATSIRVIPQSTWDAKTYRVWTFTIQYTKTTDTVENNNQG